MSIKLSELLAAAVCDMFDQANDTVPESVAETDRDDARKLRAIVPALVEVVQNSKNTCSCAFDCPECPHCNLSRAMKEAGVTCE